MLEKYKLLGIVQTLLDNPRRTYTLRTLAKEANVGVSTAKRCLDFLVDKKIVAMTPTGNVHNFNLNNNFPLTKQMKVLKNVSDILYSGLLDEIVSKTAPSSVVLYGSCAKGESDKGSDIDLLIISSRNEKFVVRSRVGREVNYQIYALNEWRRKAREDKVFYDQVIVNGITLYGEKPVVL